MSRGDALLQLSVTDGVATRSMAREAIAGHVAALQQMGAPVPAEPEHPQAIVIDVADAAA